ncbi:A disintegrin and metalloproteinase with thrombospondin motifs 3-like [Anneissia japonica]|uniref:A disintegrin and metalloproteinase with thrombospondin motifs 3-like n=1 Tax=Anneissia japonica TaxID=1529436 RepID=UPI0014254E1D|nr:A disintegrin and metalloproteinase with thrombospondin motifs 3-like [Anneissia japonica]
MLGNMHKNVGLSMLFVQVLSVYGSQTENQDLGGTHIVRPFVSTQDGTFVSFELYNEADEIQQDFNRMRRNAVPQQDERKYFGLNFEGVILVLNLTKNEHILGPAFSVETATEDGIVNVRASHEKQCFYIGSIVSDALSEAAISTCDGMNGIFKYQGAEYIIEPERRDRENSEEGTPHKITQLEQDEDNVFDLRHDSVKPTIHKKKADKTSKRRQRRAVNKYYAEVIVNVDYSMQEFHRSRDLKEYVLTLMNIVDQTFHHQSLGVEINFIVTKMVKVGQSVSSKMIVTDSMEKSLAKACAWSSRSTYQENGIGKKPDINIYMTRLQTKRAGYALVGTVCEGRQSCVISKDSGLRSALVLAHEIGHLLGFEHDNAKSGCLSDASRGSLMADKITSRLAGYFWSSCSASVLKKNISSYTCLHDNPFTGGLRQDTLPGIKFSLDDQCYFMHGGNFAHCPWANKEFNKDPCELLLCSSKDNRNYCLHDLAQTPPLEGTECGEKMWCRRNTCVAKTAPKETPKQEKETPKNEKETPKEKEKKKFSWEPKGWTDCSKSCGKGWTYKRFQCRRLSDDKIVNSKACNKENYDQKSVKKECNSKACPSGKKDKPKFAWKSSKWSECSATCGSKGKQTRKVKCVRTVNGTTKSVNVSKCKENKPSTKKNCNRTPCKG